MSSLDDLVRTELGVRGWSYAELARRSGLPRSTVHKLATTPLRRTPEPRTLSMLAAGLRIPEEQVRAAAAESLGYSVDVHPAVDPQVRVITASLERLSPDDRSHVAALVESLLHRRERAG